MIRSIMQSGLPLEPALTIVVLMVPVILLSLSLHEFAHGYAAYKCGDDTARSLGRLTLNPIKHLDFIGFICLLFFGFGWAKPVPINSRYFKRPRRDIRIVSLAGPLTNAALVLVSVLLYRITVQIAVPELAGESFQNYFMLIILGSQQMISIPATILLTFFSQAALINATLFIFNLLPIPPLDGSKILMTTLPQKAAMALARHERTITLVLYIALLAGFLSGPLSVAMQYVVYGVDKLFMLLPFFG